MVLVTTVSSFESLLFHIFFFLLRDELAVKEMVFEVFTADLGSTLFVVRAMELNW